MNREYPEKREQGQYQKITTLPAVKKANFRHVFGFLAIKSSLCFSLIQPLLFLKIKAFRKLVKANSWKAYFIDTY
jgi:hypothetical protein